MSTENTRDAEYVLGHSDSELERLIAQARIYEPLTRQFFHDAGIGADMRVLDVGCGTGDVSFLAARMVGATGQVVGVDRSPTTVATAENRALDLGVSNTQFLVGDAAELAFEEPFDAAVGRMVLQFSPDPSTMLRKIAAHVRPGGVIAFQEVDWSGCRSLPNLPTVDRCVDWGVQTLKGSGADPYIGMKLYTTYTAAEMPPPKLYLQAGIGAGADHPIYSSIAGLMRSLLPAMELLSIANRDEVDVDTLASRISAEAVAMSGTVVWISLVGAIAHTPVN